MKKIYQIPTTTIVRVQVARMIATSIQMYGVNAESEALSRESDGDFWDDEE